MSNPIFRYAVCLVFVAALVSAPHYFAIGESGDANRLVSVVLSGIAALCLCGLLSVRK